MAGAIAGVIGAMFAIGASNAVQSDAVIVNLVAQEFVELCVKHDGEIAVVEKVAVERGWHSRPPIISGDYGIPIDRAWDAEINFIAVNEVADKTSGKFVIAVANSDSRNFCQISLDEFAIESLKSALSNQGLVFQGESDWAQEKSIWHTAWYCLPDPQRAGRSYTVTAERRRLQKRPSLSGSRFSYFRNERDDHAECPSPLHSGHADGSLPEQPTIEPWLGRKPDEPPALDSKIQ